jgi:hypothetical protein
LLANFGSTVAAALQFDSPMKQAHNGPAIVGFCFGGRGVSNSPFDPYYVWLGIPPDQQPPTHYRLLGLQAFESNTDVIANAGEQRMAHLRSVQIGQHAAQSQRVLGEVALAMRVLLAPSRKAAYDEQLRQIVVPKDSANASSVSLRPAPRRTSSAPLAQSKPLPMSAPIADAGGKVATAQPAPASSSWWPLLLLLGGGIVALGLVLMLGILAVAWHWLGKEAPRQEIANHVISTPAIAPKTAASPEVEGSSAPPEQELPNEELPAEEAPELPSPAGDDSNIEAVVNSPADVTPTDPVETNSSGSIPEEPSSPSEVVASETEATPNTAPAEPEDEGPHLLSPPTAAEQRELLARLASLYPPENLKTTRQQLEAAAELLELGSAADTPPTDRFVLLRRAAELAVAACDAEILSQAITRMAADFDINAVDVEGAMLVRMAAVVDVARAPAFARNVAAFADLAAADNRYEVAARVLAATVALPDNVLGDASRASVQRQLEQTNQRRERYAAVATAERAITVDANDAEAHALLARWYCFDQNEWERGLAHMARGASDELRAIATQDLAGAATPEKRIELGNRWWDAAQKQSPADKKYFEARALFWYQQVDPNEVTGLDRALLTRRLAELTPEPETDDADSVEDGNRYAALFAKALDAVADKRFGEADRLFAHCVRMRPDDAAAANNYALTALRVGQTQRAVKQWQRMLDTVGAGPALHNLQRLRAVVESEEVPLDRTSRNTLDELITIADRNAALTPFRPRTGWLYQQADGVATVEDRFCMRCSGQGVVDCTVRACSRGKVRVMQSKVVGRNTVTGEAIVQSSSVGVPCTECRGQGTVDCDHCRDGVDGRLR